MSDGGAHVFERPGRRRDGDDVARVLHERAEVLLALARVLHRTPQRRPRDDLPCDGHDRHGERHEDDRGGREPPVERHPDARDQGRDRRQHERQEPLRHLLVAHDGGHRTRALMDRDGNQHHETRDPDDLRDAHPDRGDPEAVRHDDHPHDEPRREVGERQPLVHERCNRDAAGESWNHLHGERGSREAGDVDGDLGVVGDRRDEGHGGQAREDGRAADEKRVGQELTPRAMGPPDGEGEAGDRHPRTEERRPRPGSDAPQTADIGEHGPGHEHHAAGCVPQVDPPTARTHDVRGGTARDGRGDGDDDDVPGQGTSPPASMRTSILTP